MIRDNSASTLHAGETIGPGLLRSILSQAGGTACLDETASGTGSRALPEMAFEHGAVTAERKTQIPDLMATIRNIDAMWLEWKRLLNTGTKRRQQAAIPLFEQTRIFRNYHPSVIVGILQTAEYAAEIFRRAVEFYDIPDGVAEGVASRRSASSIFTRATGGSISFRASMRSVHPWVTQM